MDDGDIDVLSTSNADDTVAWYEDDGIENFTSHTITNSADEADGLYVADLDADGDIDVLSASVADDTVAWYENDGSQNFTLHIISTNADGPAIVFADDNDGDGSLDVLTASQNDDTIAWYENSGSPIGNGLIDIYNRGNGTVQKTLGPNPYNLTAIGNNDNNAASADTGAYELFVTKVDLTSTPAVTVFADTLIGGAGNDSLYGSSGSDLEKGGSGDDKLYGLGGNDLLNGGSGNDVLRAGVDEDTLLGGSETDRLYGGGGDDLLDGQGGDDTLDGNSGDDLLRWRIGNGSDVMNNSAGSARVEALGSGTADSLSASKTSSNRPKLTVVDGVNTVTISKTIWRTDILAGDGNDQLVVGTSGGRFEHVAGDQRRGRS